MDAKITLSFDEAVISKAKKYAAENKLSLSRLTEFLLRKVTSENFNTLEELPVSSWVSMLAEGEVQYKIKSKSRVQLKKEYYGQKK